MMIRWGPLLAVLADTDVVDVIPKQPVATVSPRRSAIAREAFRRALFPRLAGEALLARLRVIGPPPVDVVTRVDHLGQTTFLIGTQP
jgi:hypothetical protein